MKKNKSIILMIVFLLAIFMISTDTLALSVIGIGNSSVDSVVTVSHNNGTYWLETGEKIDEYIFEGLSNGQAVFSLNDEKFLVGVGGSLESDSAPAQNVSTTPSSDNVFTGRDRGNAGPVNVPDDSVIRWSVSDPDMDMEVAFQIYSDLGIIASTTAPAEGSYYIQEGGQDIVFDVNAGGGVDWTIEVIKQ